MTEPKCNTRFQIWFKFFNVYLCLAIIFFWYLWFVFTDSLKSTLWIISVSFWTDGAHFIHNAKCNFEMSPEVETQRLNVYLTKCQPISPWYRKINRNCQTFCSESIWNITAEVIPDKQIRNKYVFLSLSQVYLSFGLSSRAGHY